MMWWSNFWIIIVIGIGTYIMRAGSILLGSQMQWSDKTKQWLYFVSPAVLGALLGPLLFLKEQRFVPILQNPILFASIPTVAVAWYFRNLWLTIVVGLISYSCVYYVFYRLGW